MNKETMRMNGATNVTLAARIRALSALVGLSALLLAAFGAGSAVAAPSWSLGIVHKNIYGVGGLTSPFTGSGEAFHRGSAHNAYSVQVTHSIPSARWDLH